MLNKVQALVARHRLSCFILLCIVITIIMTSISLRIYQVSGAIQLDLSRPGYEKVRSQVKKEADDHPFGSTGALDAAALKDFDARIDKYQRELKNLGNFNTEQLDDENLGITASDNGGSNDGSSQPTHN